MTKGLTKMEIEFLAECERMYFEDLPINLEFLKKAKAKTGIKKFSSAWDYWKTINGRFVAHRDSLKNPVELDDVLGEGRLKIYDRANYNTIDKTYSIKSAEANNRILWDCLPYLCHSRLVRTRLPPVSQLFPSLSSYKIRFFHFFILVYPYQGWKSQ